MLIKFVIGLDLTAVAMDHLHPAVINIGMVWYGVVSYGLVWYGIPYYGMELHIIVWYCILWNGISMDYSDYLPTFLTDCTIHKPAGGVAQ